MVVFKILTGSRTCCTCVSLHTCKNTTNEKDEACGETNSFANLPCSGRVDLKRQKPRTSTSPITRQPGIFVAQRPKATTVSQSFAFREAKSKSNGSFEDGELRHDVHPKCHRDGKQQRLPLLFLSLEHVSASSERAIFVKITFAKLSPTHRGASLCC